MVHSVINKLDELNEKYLETRLLELILLMTGIILLLFMQHTFFLTAALMLFIPVMLLFRRVLKSGFVWTILAAVMIVGLIQIWYSADNHTYLTVYWVMTVAICLFAKNRMEVISYNARILIGLCFLFAVIWKLLAPEFSDGTFFYFTFLTDSRFFEFAELIAGVNQEMRGHNILVYNTLSDPMSRAVAGGMQSTPFLAQLSVFLAYWTLLVEGWIAVAFLLPLSSKLSTWRDIPLVIFMITTYPIATVSGFASLLAVMGFAQCTEQNRLMRTVYLAVFIGVPLFGLPYFSVLLGFL
jgi:hypothetical protein